MYVEENNLKEDKIYRKLYLVHSNHVVAYSGYIISLTFDVNGKRKLR